MGPRKTLQPVVPLQINDPCDTGSQKARKTKVLELHQLVHEQHSDTLKRWRQFSEDFKQELAALEPPLALPSSREQCITAVSRLKQKFMQLVRQWQIKRQQLHQQYNTLLNSVAIVTATAHRVECSGVKFTRNDKAVMHIEDINLSLKFHFDKTQGLDDKLLLQQQIHKLLDGQLSDVKSFVLDETSGYLQHLNKKRKSAPKVVFGNRLFRPNSSKTDLPLEIQTMIYAHADLESCVNLRRVSRTWYQAFKASEEFFENKVKEHFPWMKPEDEMNTWGLCALVFVQRRGNPRKWNCVREINRIPQSLRTPTPVHEVVANELELGEKLPLGFEPIDEDVIEVHTEEFSMWHSRTSGGQYGLSRNPKPECPQLHLKYLQCIPQPQKKEDKFSTVCRDNEKTVLKYKPGGEPTMMLVLPPNCKLHFKRESYEKHTIESTRDHVTVRCHGEHRSDDIYMFDRTKPLHYENALKHHDLYREWRQLKHVTFQASSNYGSGNTFMFADFQHRWIHNYCTSTGFPVAYYDGLIWWVSKDGTKIFPTFVDLQRPGELYCRKDKMLMIEEPHHISEKEVFKFGTLYRQSTKPGQGRFLLRNFNDGVMVIDLAFGTVTKVVNPREYQKDVILGYVDGKFCAKFVDKQTMKKYEQAGLWKTKTIDRNERAYYW